MNGRGNDLDKDRIGIHGNSKHRDGVLGCLDVFLLKGGAMREAIIISAILILALWLWMPKKGGQ